DTPKTRDKPRIILPRGGARIMGDEPRGGGDDGPRRAPSLWLIAGLASIGPFSVSLYLPALPALAEALGASSAEGQLTLTLYLAGFAVAQLVYGPASDRIGRRPTMIAGLVVYVSASLIAAAAPSVSMLLLARVAQALG